MKGNKSRKGQNDNFWRQFFGWICLLEVTILERLGWQIWTRRAFWPKWKEMKAHKAKIKGNEGPQGPNESPKGKNERNKSRKGQNDNIWRQFFGWICLLEVTILKGSGGKSGPGGLFDQNERKGNPKMSKWKKWSPKRPKWTAKRQKWKEMKPQESK